LVVHSYKEFLHFSLKTSLSQDDLVNKLHDIISNPNDLYKEFYIDVINNALYFLIKEAVNFDIVHPFKYNMYLDFWFKGKPKQIYMFNSNIEAQTYYDNLFKKLAMIQ